MYDSQFCPQSPILIWNIWLRSVLFITHESLLNHTGKADPTVYSSRYLGSFVFLKYNRPYEDADDADDDQKCLKYIRGNEP